MKCQVAILMSKCQVVSCDTNTWVKTKNPRLSLFYITYWASTHICVFIISFCSLYLWATLVCERQSLGNLECLFDQITYNPYVLVCLGFEKFTNPTLFSSRVLRIVVHQWRPKTIVRPLANFIPWCSIISQTLSLCCWFLLLCGQ